MKKSVAALVVAATLVSMSPPVARACEDYPQDLMFDTTGDWSLLTSAYPHHHDDGDDDADAAGAALAPAALALDAPLVSSPTITAWKLNYTGVTGHSINAQINNLVSSTLTDVDAVAYDSSYVYVHASDVPSHNVGPFPGNPAYPADQNRTFRIPRNPQAVPAGQPHTNVGMGTVGVMVNGVSLFNALDAATYNNDGTWHQIANVFEASSFDNGKGHPAPGMGAITPGTLSPGTYHYHQTPTALVNQLDPGNTGQHHSPILGYAFDGFPIYGSYGYANADGTGGIIHETSSYQLRSVTQRHTLADGTVLSSAQWGPDVSASYPLGDYQEDYQYVAGSGTLDQYNGRFVVTPDYPQGTYAYFLPMDANGNNVYPYTLAPQYYGVVDTLNIQRGAVITVPATATTYFALPEPATGLAALATATLLGMRRRA